MAGTFRFDAPTIVCHHQTDAANSALNVPFEFNGQVTASPATDFDALVPLFHVDLVGQGRRTSLRSMTKGVFTETDVNTRSPRRRTCDGWTPRVRLIGLVGRACNV